tara:strand:- start:191 stop:304 length:114 start_codon:yes stop_codon:yes gene_type:complete
MSGISGYGSYGIPGSGLLKAGDMYDDNNSVLSNEQHS